MKKLTKRAALTASLFALTVLTGCSKEPPVASTTPVSTMDTSVYETIATSTTTTTTAATTTTVETTTTTEFTTTEDLTSIPETSEFLDNAANKLLSAESFKMTCILKGNIPSADTETGKMIRHTFSCIVTDRATYLESTVKNLNKPSENTEYEEYQKLEDDIVTTLTRYGNSWIDNTPKEMIRCNMTEKTLNSIALLSVIMNNDITTQEIFFDDEFIERDENGNYIVTLPEWYTLSSTSEEFISHGFSGLMRSPEIKDCLHDLTLTQPNGNVVYTFDKEYNLTSMVFDIIMPEEGSYDLHGEIIFDKWNEVPIINVPRVTELEHTTTAPVTDVPVEETEITE